jgi:hypothetical protein
LTISIALTFIFSYNLAISDASADYLFVDSSKSYTALRILREKGKEEAIEFLEQDLETTIHLNKSLLESRTRLFYIINFHPPMNYGYYNHMLKYYGDYLDPEKTSKTIENLNWLISESNANKPFKQDK